MSAEKPLQRPRPFGLVIAAMCALAGGAVWCLLSLYARRDLAAFAFVVALVVVWQLRGNGWAGRWSGSIAATACVALASAYSFYLQAVAQVASMLGLPMRAAFTQMDPGMALAIARANFAGWSELLVLLALAGAAIATRIRPRTETPAGRITAGS